MQVNKITRNEFLDLVYSQAADFLRRINAPEAFVVKQFYPAKEILEFRNQVFASGFQSDPSWHPLHDDCPDYHRLHDNYPKAHVKQRMHAFYFHGWYSHNRPKFDYFREIFAIKNVLANFSENEFLGNVPSDGFIARVNVHHYPKGGGYQAEHIDPVGKHAQIQTLIAASKIGRDFQRGGVYGREQEAGERIYLDPYLEPGDLLVISPGIRHGVEFIDPDLDYDWRTNDGRWMIIPLVVGSDYPSVDARKPIQVGTGDEK